ncbi:LptE family protein [Anaerorudis cellulosivorans]|uniref:LPS assembly lipoprotein LptE n=1 Tax=Anaerorudis cellulosivorans TaxID=3397862 RepID=UPI00221EEB05|nr:LptE family protein [Seramator thermalis]MCW1734644.1 LPS assembly lipoprotein LptE [Seramator thermalis]
MKRIPFFVLAGISVLLASCSISYRFNGASVDYNTTKTLYLANFPNQAALIYPPLEQRFNEELKDMFIRNTQLRLVNQNGDLEIEGEIVGYELTPMAVQEDAFASETRLTMTVKMRYRNNKDEGQDKEETISAYRNFPSDRLLTDVQDQLIEELCKDIIDQIFNATMSNW